MFENFPYTDMHQLNLDWIVKIAKDFLEQYTHIQETIAEGETALTEKAAELERLLDEWYNTHSEDIANELANAVAEFRTEAAAIGAEVIASIPADYTALSNKVDTKLGYIVQDLANTSLNDLLTIGIYETTNSNISTITDLPPYNGSPVAGIIVVYKYLNKYVQYYMDAYGAIHTRYRASNGTWTNWVTAATSDNTAINSTGITAGSDLNTYITNGIYKIGAAAAPNILNIPIAAESVLIVNNRFDTVVQRFFAMNGISFIRAKNSSSNFSEWQLSTGKCSSVYLPNHADLNDYLTGGIYRVTGSYAANTLNIPVNTAGILFVENCDNAVLQKYATTAGAIFTRYKTSTGTFTPWSKLNYNVCSWLSNNKVFFRAHQGDKEQAPANSVPAYTLACQSNKWDIIQIAVARQSADGTWYVLHDDDLSISTNGTGNLSESTDTYINSLYINQGVNVDQYTHQELHIPTLAEVLAIARTYGKQVSIRLGSLPNNIDTEENLNAWTSFMEIINKYSGKEYILSGDNFSQLAPIQNFMNAMCELFITDNSDIRNLITTAKNNNIAHMMFFKPYEDITENEIIAAHENGYKIAVYHDTSNQTLINNDITAGYDVIQNNRL